MHEPPYSGVARCLQDGQRPVGIGEIGRQRMFNRAQHGFVRGLVKHELAPGHRVTNQRFVGDRTDNEPDAGGKVLGVSRRQIVDHHDVVAGFDERIGKMRTDETGASRDE